MQTCGVVCCWKGSWGQSERGRPIIGATLEPWHFRAMHVVVEGVCAAGGVGLQVRGVYTSILATPSPHLGQHSAKPNRQLSKLIPAHKTLPSNFDAAI